MDGFTKDVFLIWLGSTLQAGLILAFGDRVALVIPVSRAWIWVSLFFILIMGGRALV